MTPLCSKWGLKINMINKLLGAAAMAAVAFAVVPASAAKMGGCSGENLGKTESMIETMADGEGKNAAQKEIAQAQDGEGNHSRRIAHYGAFVIPHNQPVTTA